MTTCRGRSTGLARITYDVSKVHALFLQENCIRWHVSRVCSPTRQVTPAFLGSGPPHSTSW